MSIMTGSIPDHHSLEYHCSKERERPTATHYVSYLINDFDCHLVVKMTVHRAKLSAVRAHAHVEIVPRVYSMLFDHSGHSTSNGMSLQSLLLELSL